MNVKAAEHELMRNRFLYEFGARGIFPTGCLELGLIVVRFRRTLTLTLTKPSSKPSFAIHYLYSQISPSFLATNASVSFNPLSLSLDDFVRTAV